MEQFAGYGFNKSHSAAYAYLAFVTAYLKAHYPVDFMAALLTSETGNTAKVVKYINECREMGITILPPDVNHSDWSFTPDGQAHPLRAGSGEEPGAIGGGGHRQGARGGGALRFAAPVLREGGPGRRQPAHDREPDSRRRHGFARRRRARRNSRPWKAPWKRAARLARPRERAGGAVRRDAMAAEDARSAAAQRARLDRQRKAGAARKKCWASG